jgi:hypothetical protein
VRTGEGASARTQHATAEIGEGASSAVTITMPPVVVAAPSPSPPPQENATPAPGPAEPPAPGVPPVAKASFVITGVAGAIGLVTGAVALDKRNQLDRVCNTMQECGPQLGGRSTLDSAYGWATASTVSFAVAGIGLVVGVAGLVGASHPRPPAQGAPTVMPWIGAGSAGTYGRF